MRALVAADGVGLLLELAAQHAIALDLGVEGRLQLLERQGEVEDRVVARAARRRRGGRRAGGQQRAAADERPAQELGAGGAVQAPQGLGQGAVAVDGLEALIDAHPYFTNPVRATAAWASLAEIGLSAAWGAGFSPTMSRIHDAWRASTETIRAASASASGVRLVAAPL